MTISMTRRNFLNKLMGGLVLFTGGCSKKWVWPIRGTDVGSVRLAFYTDVHARTEWDTPKAMALAADAINSRKSDIVVAGGDLITDGFQSSAAKVEPRWDAYMKMHRAIKADVYPAIGNHDLVAVIPEDGTPAADNPRAEFLDRMGLGQTYYSFTAVGYHFIFLDAIQISRDEYPYQGMVWPEQLAWLKKDLSAVSKDMPIVMVTHMPLLSAFYNVSEGATSSAPPNRVVVNNCEVLKVMENHNLILVLQGHLHVNEMIRWRGTTFITGGAICGKWWRGNWYGTEEGFYDIMLTGDHVECSYVDYGWEARRPLNK
jgi:3',5'-cyclic-AMP phosphodiesterase